MELEKKTEVTDGSISRGWHGLTKRKAAPRTELIYYSIRHMSQ